MLPIKLVLVRICNFAGNELRLRFLDKGRRYFLSENGIQYPGFVTSTWLNVLASLILLR